MKGGKKKYTGSKIKKTITPFFFDLADFCGPPENTRRGERRGGERTCVSCKVNILFDLGGGFFFFFSLVRPRGLAMSYHTGGQGYL